MDSVERAIRLTCELVDIDSTTGSEEEAGRYISGLLSALGYTVVEQPVAEGRFNVYAHLGVTPSVVFSTHYDCVPPFFPSRRERDLIVGRGACDAKGILAAQVAAGEQLRAAGQKAFGFLFLVGEERGSEGARVANALAPPGVAYLINGEPTDNRQGLATRGSLRVRLSARGRAAHSSFPELGVSAIDKLLDALMVIRGVDLPDDPELGRTHYSVGLIEGGIAPNVVSPSASAELVFRTVGRGADVVAALDVVRSIVDVEPVVDIPAVRMYTEPGFETAVFPFTTDVPLLTNWGRPILMGPGSIHVAHTDHEHLAVDELASAISLYASLAARLLADVH